jgi:hypothetical protein
MLPSEKHSGSAGVRINILFQFSILNKKGMNNNSLVNSLLRKPHKKNKKEQRLDCIISRNFVSYSTTGE